MAAQVIDMGDAASFEIVLAQQPPEQGQVQDERSQSLLQLALVSVGITFAPIFAVPGGLKDHGSAVKAKSLAFNVFLAADVVSLVASMIVALILAAVAPNFHTKKLVWFTKAVLCAAVGLASLALLSAAYVVMPPVEKWIAIAIGVATMLLTSSAYVYIISFC